MGMEESGAMSTSINKEELKKPEETPLTESIIEPNISSQETETEQNQKNESSHQEVEDFGNRLCEHIVGVKLDDPTLPDRLIEDQEIIRAKYSLPSLESRGNLGEWERSLMEIAKSVGVVIRQKSECGQFFKDYPYAGGVHFGNDKKIGVDIDRTSFETHSKSLGILEHELIHALQNKYYPRMSVELREYEAYVAGGNNRIIKEHPQIARLVFENLIGASVEHWYHQTSKDSGKKVVPPWL